MHGEDGEVQKDDPVLLLKLEELYKEIKKYDPSQIYNMDETDIFLELLQIIPIFCQKKTLKQHVAEKGQRKSFCDCML